MAMPATTRWTAEMVRALPDDGKRYVGRVFVSPADITFPDGSLTQPDVFVAPLLGKRPSDHGHRAK